MASPVRTSPSLKTDSTHSFEKSQPSDGEFIASTVKWRFRLTLASTCLITFISSLGSSIATALPTISDDLDAGNSYVWIASSYVFAQTIVQPSCAQLCNIFGRRWPMILAVVLFAVGSAISGSSKSAAVLIAGRTIQGIASGCIMMLSELIVCDLVPLRQRGQYVGFVLATIALGTIVGPLVGGALAQTNWRWIFYLNLPIAGIVVLVMLFFLRLRHVKEPTWVKALARIDWTGNFLFVGSMCSILIGIVSGGSSHPWSSWRIILPICMGVIGWGCFHAYEGSNLPREPSIPPHLFRNRTSVAGYYMTFLSSLVLQWAGFFWPVYFQALRGASSLKSGINLLPFLICLMPVAAISGILLSKFGRYRILHFLGFSLVIIGLGLNTLLTKHTDTVVWAILQMINAAGQGILVPTLLPAILASLSEKDVATATGLYSFLRSFGFIWGLTIPGLIFNSRFDQVSGKIGEQRVRDNLSGGRAYEVVGSSYIDSLPENVKDEVLAAYTEALKAVWYGSIAFGLAGILAVLVEKHVPLRKRLETDYGLEASRAGGDEEKGDQIATEMETRD